MNFLKQTAAALVITAISFAGCKKNNGDDEPKAPAISMTTAMEGEVVIRLAGSGTAVIDWGDGSAPQTVTLSVYEHSVSFTESQRYAYTFQGTTSFTIIIDGQNITHLAYAGLQLTVIDMSKNTAPVGLYCAGNRLTVEGLNALFGTLHSNASDKNIIIWGNPAPMVATRVLPQIKAGR